MDITQPGDSDMPDDIPDIDISQPGNSGPSEELDVPQPDEPAGSDPDLGEYEDSHMHSGDDWHPPPEDRDLVATIQLPQLQIAQQYIELLHSATLDSSGMLADDIADLRNLGQEYTLMDPSPLLRSICHFVNNLTASRKHYELMRTIEHPHRPDDPILSFDQVKQRVRWLSGVVPVEHDMCVNSCLAFTGPCDTLNTCSHSGESRYCLGTTKPQKHFTTVPMGPVIQAMYGLRRSQIRCII